MVEPGDIIIDRYRVLEDLNGRFSKTFEVQDTIKNDLKVMKVLIPCINPRLEEFFQREFTALRKFQHPGIPRGQEYGYYMFRCPHTDEILHGFVMEKIAGQDLGKWLRENERITNTEQAIEWLEQLIDILSYVHSQNYLHRDIKPSNIMLKPDGKLVLIDFGIVKAIIQREQKEHDPATIIGTPGYNSREQQQGLADIDYRADFFSLGRTFLHLLTGTCPGPDEHPRFRQDQSGNLLWQDQAPGISQEFKDLIDYLMEPRRERRPQNIKQILELIDNIRYPQPGVVPIEDDESVGIPTKLGKPPQFRPLFVFSSVAFNFVFLTLPAMGVRLEEIPGLQVLFVVIICVISGFLVVPWIKYYLL
ncbi:serine/threonine-protein kinase [Dolichospermum planctonicum CS-1226]|uniref:non-specific serine/threonine protein kinase n=1 Tax=Dolichospermum planctonicum CS-1226 TaxID=3021751 RepID=A0ABT5ADM3_9CYAN|nr:serine/threonine-protein kinase [Dolichospermum planctonicum]MDB9535067.1 serine/threonine-protein kinase [Dolichospermum planctonicum CS-1226]